MAFALSAGSMTAFGAGAGAALLSGTAAGPGWMAAGTALILFFFAFTFWRPLGWRMEFCLAATAGWLTGLSWNGLAIAQGISGADLTTLLYLAGAVVCVYPALTLLVLPTFLIFAKRTPPVWLKGGMAICGVIVALQMLTGFTLRQ